VARSPQRVIGQTGVMRRWEYRAESSSYWLVTLAETNRFGVGDLNRLGAEGWERVAVTVTNYPEQIVTIYYFKRPLPADPLSTMPPSSLPCLRLSRLEHVERFAQDSLINPRLADVV
jgi:hypothetical protein